MQIEALDTFVKIVEAGSFNRAAEVLHVTPSTVSSRIQMVEDSLGQRLFQRSRTQVTLTQAGSVFLPYALSVVRSWQNARREIALPKGFNGILTVAAPPVIWRDLMPLFLAAFQKSEPAIAINAVVADPATALTKLNTGEVDVAVLYEPSVKAGWSATKVYTDELLLLSTTKRALVRWHPQYVYVDWGRQFADEHSRAYPVDDTPIVTFSDASAAADYLFCTGGSAYLPQRWLKSFKSRLYAVPHAPAFEVSAYAVFDAELAKSKSRQDILQSFIKAAHDTWRGAGKAASTKRTASKPRMRARSA